VIFPLDTAVLSRVVAAAIVAAFEHGETGDTGHELLAQE
jgi:hypothetical protein